MSEEFKSKKIMLRDKADSLLKTKGFDIFGSKKHKKKKAKKCQKTNSTK